MNRPGTNPIIPAPASANTALRAQRAAEPIIRQLQNLERDLPEGPLTPQHQQQVDSLINSLEKILIVMTNEQITEYIRYIRRLQDQRLNWPHDLLEMVITKISRVRAGGRRRSRKMRKSRKGRKGRSRRN
jgi:hypothetical protein